MEKEYFLSEKPEKDYIKTVSYGERKKIGQFFTPKLISDLMASWVVNAHGTKILDPSMGLGIFFRSIIKNHPKQVNDLEFFGIEKDTKILEQSKKLFQNYHPITKPIIHYINEDFLDNWEMKYDGIICNPPYLKFNDYENKDSILKFRSKFDQNFSGLSNIYSLFILKSLKQLNKGGRAAFIVPSEFMNADYGKEIKKFIKKNFTLRFIIVIDFNMGVFDDVTTTSAILLFADDENAGNIQFIDVTNIDNFNLIKARLNFYPEQGMIGKMKKLSELDENKKWRNYYQEMNSDKYKNLVPFSDYANVSRGIATGANGYFTFSEKKLKQYKIDKQKLLPCVTKAADITNSFFEKSDFEKLKNNDKSVYLLNASDLNDSNLRRYIELGEKEGINKRYLTSHRNPWYSIENKDPAPILVKVFNRAEVQFIRNEANVYNLTSFHCVYLNSKGKSKIDIITAYLLTDIAKQIFNDNRREYGNGLKKFEPNDFNNSLMIDLDLIDKENELLILKLLKKLRENESNGKNTEKIKKDLNSIFRIFLISH